ncbi:MAG TPA: ABC transporter permease subunit, partial [Actinotalea sp.]|nr:ABC transporter permease subunit [Actinotalea sp.]
MTFFVDNWEAYLAGFVSTLRLTVLSAVVALAWGMVIGAFRVSPLRPLRLFAAVWVELFRNTPLTLAFFFLVFVAPVFA